MVKDDYHIIIRRTREQKITSSGTITSEKDQRPICSLIVTDSIWECLNLRHSIWWGQATVYGMVRRGLCILGSYLLSRAHTTLSCSSLIKGRHRVRGDVQRCLVRSCPRHQEKGGRQAQGQAETKKMKSKNSPRRFQNSKKARSRRNPLCLRWTSFYVTLFFMRLQGIQMSWSGGSRVPHIQIQAQSLEWKFGVKWLISLQDHQKQDSLSAQADHVACRVECWEVKGCHSAILSLVWAHLKVWSSQWWEGVRHNQNHLGSSECQRQSSSSSECQYQRDYDMVSSSCSSHQLLQQCGPHRDKSHLSIQHLRQERGGQLCRERQRPKIKSTSKKGRGQKDRQAVWSLRKANQKEKGRPSQRAKVNAPLGHGITIRVQSPSQDQSDRKRSQRQKWQRKGPLSGPWKVRSLSSSMLVVYSAARSSESATISELKASLQYQRVSSGSSNSDSSTRPTSRISRSMTSCSISTKRTNSSIKSLWVSVFCSSLPWPGGWIQRS